MPINEKNEHHNDSYSRIVQEARQLFITGGYEGISMRAISEACGISKGGIYHHFRDKESLFMAIIEEYMAKMESLISECQAQTQSCRGQISCFVRGVFRFSPEERAVTHLAIHEMSHIGQEAQRELAHRYRERITDRLAIILRRGMDSGELRPMNPDHATWILMGAMYPFFHPQQTLEEIDDDVITQEVLTVFFEGISAPTL